MLRRGKQGGKVFLQGGGGGGGLGKKGKGGRYGFVLTDFKDSPPPKLAGKAEKTAWTEGGTDQGGGNKRPKKRFSIRLVFNFSAFNADRKRQCTYSMYNSLALFREGPRPSSPLPCNLERAGAKSFFSLLRADGGGRPAALHGRAGKRLIRQRGKWKKNGGRCSNRRGQRKMGGVGGWGRSNTLETISTFFLLSHFRLL